MANKYITWSRIPLFYRIYFLYFEPLAALGGVYLCFFQPTRFIEGTVAHSFLASHPASLTISPLMQMMLTNIGSLYILFAVQEGIVLRLTREKAVWIAIMVSMLATDCGHVYAARRIAPERLALGELAKWNSDEWVNYGTLLGGMVLRALFLMGVGAY